MFFIYLSSSDFWLKRALEGLLNVLEQIIELSLLLRNLIIVARRLGSRGIRPMFTLRNRLALLNAWTRLFLKEKGVCSIMQTCIRNCGESHCSHLVTCSIDHHQWPLIAKFWKRYGQVNNVIILILEYLVVKHMFLFPKTSVPN